MIFEEEMWIEAGYPLSAIELPEHEYGTFSWKNEDYVPDSAEEMCTILFKPNKKCPAIAGHRIYKSAFV